jgi:hypothetical protein
MVAASLIAKIAITAKIARIFFLPIAFQFWQSWQFR